MVSLADERRLRPVPPEIEPRVHQPISIDEPDRNDNCETGKYPKNRSNIHWLTLDPSLPFVIFAVRKIMSVLCPVKLSRENRKSNEYDDPSWSGIGNHDDSEQQYCPAHQADERSLRSRTRFTSKLFHGHPLPFPHHAPFLIAMSLDNTEAVPLLQSQLPEAPQTHT